jgi:integrase
MSRGHLEHLLAPRSKVQPAEHFPALDWREAPSFMAKLREQDGIGAVALRVAILTAARSSSVRGATWDELDLDQAVWTIPGLRMKAGKERKTPLSKAATALLEPLALLRNGERGLSSRAGATARSRRTGRRARWRRGAATI